MNSPYEKILELPAPEWEWSPEKVLYSEFSPDEQDDLIALINEEHLDGVNEDEMTESEECASTHAYRILASFLDPAHIPLFIEWLFSPEFEDHDLYYADFINILPRYGSNAIQPCLDAFNNQEEAELDRMVLCDALAALASKGIQAELIRKNLSDYIKDKHYSRLLNSHIIITFSEEQKKEHLDIIRESFADHLVDLSMDGDFEELEMKLGLRESRTTPCDNFFEAEDKDRHLALKNILGPRPSENDPSSLLIYLLDLYGVDGGITDPSALDGYLTATLLNPIPQTPADFLPAIWDPKKEYTPSWDHPDDADFFEDFISAVRTKITKNLTRRKIHPLIGLNGDNSHNSWLRGFLRGYSPWVLHKKTNADQDDNLTELEDATISIIFKILTEQLTAEENNTRPKTKILLKNLHSSIYKQFKQNYTEVDTPNFARLASTQYESNTIVRDEAKTSRNAPCPCGSGKKYKRCCMN